MDLALLLLRLVVGLYLFEHGTEKLFGWFGGPGIKKTIGMMDGVLGFRPARFWAVLGVLSEVGGGLLLAFGLFAPLGAVAIAAAMLVAVGIHWTKGPMASKGGYELALTNLAAAVALGFVGGGAYSLDALTGFVLPEPIAIGVGLLIAVVGAIVAFAGRRTVPQLKPAQQTH
jgi:putative oxidoreductase